MVRFKSIVKGVLLFLGLLVVDGIIQSIYLVGTNSKTSLPDAILVTIIMVAAEIAMVLPIIHFFKTRFDSFSFYKVRPEDILATLKYVVIILMGNILLNLVHMMFVGKVSEAANQASIESMAKPSMIIGLIFMITLVAPFIEEIMFRGIIMNYITYGLPKWIKIVISGVAFGLFHVIGDTFQLFALIQYSFMGCVLAYAYLSNNRLQSSIMVHMGNNIIASVPLLLIAFIK
mgnify:CR=1 FL=1